MTFSEAEEYLLGLEQFGMRFGLDRMRALMVALEQPHTRFEQVHVVGTNGKTSTARFTAALLERHGLRSGSCTSPHLGSFRERIEVGEKPISEGRFAAALTRAARAAQEVDDGRAEDDRVTQFEALTAAALSELAESGVQAAAIEAGLGGRLDATNVIGSRVQVLTGVDLEHTRWLGSTIAEIAEEKLAVVREGSDLVVGPDLHPDARRVAERVTAEKNAGLVTAEPGVGDLQVAGAFQKRNFALAIAAAQLLVSLQPLAVGAAARETHVRGRLEVVGHEPLTVLDGAHNPAGARALAAALPGLLQGRAPLVLVVSVLEDKDAHGLLEPLLSPAHAVVFTRCANPRALGAADLQELAKRLGGPFGEVVSEPRAAVARAREIAGLEGAVVATGSIYLIADLVREDGSIRASTL